VTLQAAPEGQPEDVIALIADEAQAAVEEASTSEYYIGIALGELPEVAKKQLKLEHGLVVDDILPDSPAAKAEFKQHDVLVRVGELVLAQPADILKAVDEAKDKEMRVIVLRDGKELTLQVTPQKRPKAEASEQRKVETLEARLPGGAIQKIEEALRELKRGQGGQAVELHFAHPGVVARSTLTRTVAELPKNLKISITRDGDGPAKIHVERDGKEWNTTDDKLMDLPADVRGHVEQMLSKVIHPMLADRARRSLVGGPKIAPTMPGAYVAPPLSAVPRTPATAPTPATPTVTRIHAYRVAEGKSDSLEAKLDLILKKLTGDDDDKSLEKLRDEVERLRKEVEALKSK
jgi:membrane-associated protease RseP (regulator of RpoE activity)